MIAREVDGLLVDGACDNGVGLALHGKLRRLADVMEGGLSGQRRDLFIFPAMRRQEAEVDQVDDARFVDGLRGVFNLFQAAIAAGEGDGVGHGGGVADHDGHAFLRPIVLREGFDGNLRADSGGVTHGNSEYGQHNKSSL